MTSNQGKVLLKDIVIDSESKAITVMAGMLEVAQSRGVFNIEESAKLWECIKKFQVPPPIKQKDEEKTNVVMNINEKSEQ
tara:strand:- start:1224 stop:1463 length:240 start_codon:yes stop_codon:yes gene_type:complete